MIIDASAGILSNKWALRHASRNYCINILMLPKNQWARALVNSNGRRYHRRMDTCKTEKQVKDAPAVVRWGEPPMLKLAKNVVIWSKDTDSERV